MSARVAVCSARARHVGIGRAARPPLTFPAGLLGELLVLPASLPDSAFFPGVEGAEGAGVGAADSASLAAADPVGAAPFLASFVLTSWRLAAPPIW